MSRGDGLEIDSAISSTALSLHYLHFCKFWRYFIQFNYHSGSAREAISTSSPNASQSLPSTTTPSPASSESSSKNPVKTGSSKLPKLHSFLYNSFNVATNSFILIVLSGFYLACKRYAFFALKWETSSQNSKPSAPLFCTLRTFLMSRHFPMPFTRSPSVTLNPKLKIARVEYMEEIDLEWRKNGRRNTEELILSILQKTRNELKKNETPNTIPNSFFLI